MNYPNFLKKMRIFKIRGEMIFLKVFDEKVRF